jgi:hypothetical protein
MSFNTTAEENESIANERRKFRRPQVGKEKDGLMDAERFVDDDLVA